jgi:hypothetical protein
MSKQRLHDSEINTGLSKNSAKRVTQRMRMTTGHPCRVTVVTENCAQPSRG